MEGKPVDGISAALALFPVSVKGVVIRDRRVLLLRNERDEWELPGGKLDLGEDPLDCVAREISEEVGWPVTAGPLLDAWQYHIRDGVDVLIITYGCHAGTDADPALSHEHKELACSMRRRPPRCGCPRGTRNPSQPGTDTTTLTDLLAKVYDKQDPNAVAKAWLAEVGFANRTRGGQ